jgi:hypothetical protein
VARGHQFQDHAAAGRVDLENFDIRDLSRDHVFGSFVDDVAGLKNLPTIGETMS